MQKDRQEEGNEFLFTGITIFITNMYEIFQ